MFPEHSTGLADFQPAYGWWLLKGENPRKCAESGNMLEMPPATEEPSPRDCKGGGTGPPGIQAAWRPPSRPRRSSAREGPRGREIGRLARSPLRRPATPPRSSDVLRFRDGPLRPVAPKAPALSPPPTPARSRPSHLMPCGPGPQQQSQARSRRWGRDVASMAPQDMHAPSRPRPSRCSSCPRLPPNAPI